MVEDDGIKLYMIWMMDVMDSVEQCGVGLCCYVRMFVVLGL